MSRSGDSVARLLVARLPAGKGKLIAIGAGSFAIVAIALGIWLWPSSEEDETPPAEDVVVATTTTVPPQPPVVAPPPVAPPIPAPVPEVVSAPSDAELFYAANLAFETGDYEKSKSELTVLLERKPDFAPALELMARVDAKLAPKPRVTEEVRRPREERKKPEPPPAPVVPNRPEPADLFDAAQKALARGDIPGAQKKLAELNQVNPAYAGASNLQEQIDVALWAKKLPLSFRVRHNHGLGSCDGFLHLTPTGYGFRSREHEWTWSFSSVAQTERKKSNRLRLETMNDASFNFELYEMPSDEDWSRHQALRNR